MPTRPCSPCDRTNPCARRLVSSRVQAGRSRPARSRRNRLQTSPRNFHCAGKLRGCGHHGAKVSFCAFASRFGVSSLCLRCADFECRSSCWLSRQPDRDGVFPSAPKVRPNPTFAARRAAAVRYPSCVEIRDTAGQLFCAIPNCVAPVRRLNVAVQEAADPDRRFGGWRSKRKWSNIRPQSDCGIFDRQSTQACSAPVRACLLKQHRRSGSLSCTTEISIASPPHHRLHS